MYGRGEPERTRTSRFRFLKAEHRHQRHPPHVHRLWKWEASTRGIRRTVICSTVEGIPQTCPPSTSCMMFLGGHRHYDSYTFENTSGGPQCVTIDTHSACGLNHFIFTAAYLGSFDPPFLCTNWIGDSGNFPNPDQAFQVNVDNGQTLVIVVSEVTPDAGCQNYTVTITGLCGGGTRPTPTSRPRPTPGPRPTP